MSNYPTGNVVRVSTAFTASGVAADPTNVYLRLRTPDSNTPTVYTYGSSAIVKDSTGNYHFDITMSNTAGNYFYRWEGSGAVIAAAESSFTADHTYF